MTRPSAFIASAAVLTCTAVALIRGQDDASTATVAAFAAWSPVLLWIVSAANRRGVSPYPVRPPRGGRFVLGLAVVGLLITSSSPTARREVLIYLTCSLLVILGGLLHDVTCSRCSRCSRRTHLPTCRPRRGAPRTPRLRTARSHRL